jgi:hypothetical protein
METALQVSLSSPLSISLTCRASLLANSLIYADLFLMCERSGSKRSFQIWRNRKAAGFHLAGEWDLPAGAGAVTFADMGKLYLLADRPGQAVLCAEEYYPT